MAPGVMNRRGSPQMVVQARRADTESLRIARLRVAWRPTSVPMEIKIMPQRLTLFLTLAAGVLLGALVGTAGAQTTTPAKPAKPGTLKMIRTWSYVGPRAALGGARIQLLDRTGRVLATGKTTSTGTYTFDVRKFRDLKLPLSVRTSGGKAAGKAFSGHMQARVFIATTKGPIAQVSVISTAASQLSSTLPGYAAATMKVRKAMGIPKSALPDVLRLRNGYVGYAQLMRAAKKAGGFDAFAEGIAASATAGKRVKGLAPASAHRSSAVKVGITKRSTTYTCSYPIPSGATTSDQIITDMASAGAGILLKGVGVPSAATSRRVFSTRPEASRTARLSGSSHVSSNRSLRERMAGLVATSSCKPLSSLLFSILMAKASSPNSRA